MKISDNKYNIDEYLPDGAKYILEQLQLHHHSAWIVGGCVRDFLMKKKPSDWDICTNALPEEILLIFKKTIPTGIKHGTISVLENGDVYEVTTLRIDGEYGDNRRPDQVIFTKDIEMDLSRRDFTMNSIAMDVLGQITDPFKGSEDISLNIIRCVGDPDKRFKEDGLRMLRALRFKAQLHFAIDETTANGIRKNHLLIKNISSERIKSELEKILLSENPGDIYGLHDFGLLDSIMPELIPSIHTYQTNTFHEQTVAAHTAKALKASPSSPIIRWAVLFHDIGKPNRMTVDEAGTTHFYGHEKESVQLSKAIMERLHFSNEYIEKISKLILLHDLWIEPTERSVRRAINKISEELFPLFLELKKADISGQHPRYVEDRLRRIPEIENILEGIKLKNQCFSLKNLKVNGTDLIQLGITPGIQIGNILNELLEMVLDEPALNTAEALLEKAKSLKDQEHERTET